MTASALKILVADDEEVIRKLYGVALQELGHTCTFAVDGQDCIEKFESEGPFDVLFCDLVMPRVEGHKVVHHVAGLYPETKIVCCSVQDDEFAISELLHKGATAYLVKPIRVEDIHNVMKTLAG